MSQKPLKFEKDIVISLSMNYLFYLPKDYGKVKKKWPLILFLHGAGECGDDVEIVKRNGIPKIAEKMNLQFVCVSPQCPEDSYWEEHFETLNVLLDEISEKYDIDEDRVYVTGISMGGYGTWSFVTVYSHRIAAAIPICGGGNPDYALHLKEIPIWAFHGEKDDIVPIEESEAMVEAVREQGGNVRFTVYEDAGHDSWTMTYDNPDIYDWLLENSRGNN